MKITRPIINFILSFVFYGNAIVFASESENISSVTNKPNAKIPSDNALQNDYEIGYKLLQKMRNAETLKFGKLPKGIAGVALVVSVPDCLKDKVEKNVLQELMEYELRKNSIKVLEMAQFILIYEIEAFEIDDTKSYSYTQKLSLLTRSDFTVDGTRFYTVSSPIWSTSVFGILGRQNNGQKKFNSDLTEFMARFCNKLLETREN